MTVTLCFLWTADVLSLLDVVKVADSLVFVLDSAEGWDSYGEYCLSCLFAQGLPSHGESKDASNEMGQSIKWDRRMLELHFIQFDIWSLCVFS